MEEKAIVRIWKAPEGKAARYVTVTEAGKMIFAYRKLSDIRNFYKYQIAAGSVELKRELQNTYSPENSFKP